MYFSAEERPTRKPRHNITNLSVRKSLPINIKAKDDKLDCFITGVALTHNGTILLADENNSNIKSVSQDSKVLSVLSLHSNPCAITVLDTTTAVATARKNKLYIINITDNTTLSLRSKSKLDYEIIAMVAYNGNLAVTCDTSPKTTKLITIDGRVLWSVPRDTTGPNLFDWPLGITTTSITDTTAVVVVSDHMKNTLTLLEAQTGKFIRSVDLGIRLDGRTGKLLRSVGKEKMPRGITTDSDGNYYVCYCDTNEICVRSADRWSAHFRSADFQESKILLSRGDQLGERPYCIVYSAVDDSLYVSYSLNSDSRNTVDSFRLV